MLPLPSTHFCFLGCGGILSGSNEPLLARPTQCGHSPHFAVSSPNKSAWCENLWLLSELWASGRCACFYRSPERKVVRWMVTSGALLLCLGWWYVSGGPPVVSSGLQGTPTGPMVQLARILQPLSSPLPQGSEQSTWPHFMRGRRWESRVHLQLDRWMIFLMCLSGGGVDGPLRASVGCRGGASC